MIYRQRRLISEHYQCSHRFIFENFSFNRGISNRQALLIKYQNLHPVKYS